MKWVSRKTVGAAQCRSFVFANWCLLKLSSILPTEIGKYNCYLFNDCISNEWLADPWKDLVLPLVFKLRRVWEKILPQKVRERICNCNFSRVNFLRKRRSQTYSQEETCLNLSHTKGNVGIFLHLLTTGTVTIYLNTLEKIYYFQIYLFYCFNACEIFQFNNKCKMYYQIDKQGLEQCCH